MVSQNYSTSHQHRFNRQSRRPKKYIPWLLLALMIAIPGQVIWQAQPTLAQSAIGSSLALDKNVVYVNPNIGEDGQTGQKSSPLKTITQALKVATPGSTIKLASGTYSEETGETFPLIVKNKITLSGNVQGQGHKVIIQGSGYFVSPTGAGQNVAIAALRDAAGITGITVTNEYSRGHGLWIESASPQVVSNTFTRNNNTGVSVNGNSAPLIENNYFYNNGGNGLLVYGTSKPEVIDNTFEQTGFGVSLVQDTASTLTGNYFDSNRIAILLEGNSQAILRDNEVINSGEYGLTAISQALVDLGTTAEPGNNTFRSNKKLDIQNASNNEIVAVGTQTQGKTQGNINFDSGESIATNSTPPDLPPLLSQRSLDNPLPARLNIPAPKSTPTPSTQTTASNSLPAPPPLGTQNTGNKELVFTAPSSSGSPKTEPVPYPPAISSAPTALSSSASLVKYKVLVEALNQNEENRVRSLYPQAFSTVYQGQSLLQIGAFSNLDKAKRAERSLTNLGLATYFLE